jgi:hypothetical protein
MALRVLQFRLPTNKTLKVEIEETMQVSAFINQLKSKQVLDSSKDFSLKTLSGIDVADTATFRGSDVSDYIIAEAIVYTAPPPPPPPVHDWGLGQIISPQAFHQLGIFVIDGSYSMTGKVPGNITRAQAVNGAVRETLTRFKMSRKKDCFSFSIVAFGDYAQTITQAERVTSIDDNANYDPLQYFGGGSSSTNIGSGLSEASNVATNFLNNKTSSVPHKVAIVLLTDGMCHEEAKTKLVAEQLKQNPNVQVFCCCLEEVGKSVTDAEALLKQIASNPVTGYKTVYDKDTIRGFFVNSITAATGLAHVD